VNAAGSILTVGFESNRRRGGRYQSRLPERVSVTVDSPEKQRGGING
jgi:hypothetical protein